MADISQLHVAVAGQPIRAADWNDEVQQLVDRTNDLPASAYGDGTVGVAALAKVPMVLANKFTKSLLHNTETAIDFSDPDSFDTSSMHDPASNNTHLVVPVGGDGIYDAWAQADLLSTLAGVEPRVRIKKNGTTVVHSHYFQESAGTSNFSTITYSMPRFPVSLVAGDYIEILWTQFDAASTTRAFGEFMGGLFFRSKAS